MTILKMQFQKNEKHTLISYKRKQKNPEKNIKQNETMLNK